MGRGEKDDTGTQQGGQEGTGGRKRGEEGRRGEKRESEKETMNNAYCHKHKIRIRKFLPELATRSPVVD